jgi:hypothetical protein
MSPRNNLAPTIRTISEASRAAAFGGQEARASAALVEVTRADVSHSLRAMHAGTPKPRHEPCTAERHEIGAIRSCRDSQARAPGVRSPVQQLRYKT